MKFALAVLADASTLVVGSANASDNLKGSEYPNGDLVQLVRLVFNEYGRCYRARR